MTQTITQNIPLNTLRLATGAYLDTGTVAAYNFDDLGFKPRYIKIINATDRIYEEWYEGMDDASSIQVIADGTATLTTTLGLTVNDRGFTFGLNTSVNVSSKQVYFIALG